MPLRRKLYKRKSQLKGQRSFKEIRNLRRGPFFLPVVSAIGVLIMIAVVLSAFKFTGRSSLLSPISTTSVQISYDKQTRVLPTTAETVGELLDKLDIKLNPSDTVEPSRDSRIYGDKFRVNVYRGRPVLIVDGNKRIFAVSSATTPRSIAKQVGIDVYPEDKLSVKSAGDFMDNYVIGKQIDIQPSTPVTVNLYGRFTSMRTLSSTVGDFLKEKGIKIPAGSNVLPSKSANITPGMQIFVATEGTTIEVETEEIAMPVEVINDNSLSFGVTVIRQNGSSGKKLITYQVNEETGERKKIQEFIATQPVTQIIARGRAISIPDNKRAIMAQAGLSESDFPFVDYIISRESGWCPTKLQGQYGHCPGYAAGSYPSGKGYGLCQATPGTKMASAGKDWETSAITQLRWCSGYATGRYGSWEAAYNFWVNRHWW